MPKKETEKEKAQKMIQEKLEQNAKKKAEILINEEKQKLKK